MFLTGPFEGQACSAPTPAPVLELLDEAYEEEDVRTAAVDPGSGLRPPPVPESTSSPFREPGSNRNIPLRLRREALETGCMTPKVSDAIRTRGHGAETEKDQEEAEAAGQDFLFSNIQHEIR